MVDEDDAVFETRFGDFAYQLRAVARDGRISPPTNATTNPGNSRMSRGAIDEDFAVPLDWVEPSNDRENPTWARLPEQLFELGAGGYTVPDSRRRDAGRDDTDLSLPYSPGQSLNEGLADRYDAPSATLTSVASQPSWLKSCLTQTTPIRVPSVASPETSPALSPFAWITSGRSRRASVRSWMADRIMSVTSGPVSMTSELTRSAKGPLSRVTSCAGKDGPSPSRRRSR